MSFKTIAATFLLIFFAELGDKTQLTTMLLSSQTKSPAAVFIGASLALLTTTLLGVLLGDLVSRTIPLRYIRLVAGAAFIVIGGLLISGKF